MDRIGVS